MWDCSSVQYTDTKDYGRRIDLGWSCHVCLAKPMYHHEVGVWEDQDGVFHPMNTQTWAMLSTDERIGLLYG